jgi:G2/mitotic-specific cyclin 1/2
MSYLMIIKVSTILVREWAVGRWEEGEQVSLAEELPAIHARNRAEWERQAPGGEEVFRCIVNI